MKKYLLIVFSLLLWLNGTAATSYAFSYFANTGMRQMGSIGVSTTSTVAVGAANSSCTSCHYDGSFTAYFRAEVKDSRYRFKGWSTSASYFWSYSTELSCSKFVGSGNSVSLYAWFEEIPAEVTVSVATAVHCDGMGVIGGGGSFSAGTQVTVSASANEGYVFKGWSTSSDGSSIVSTAAEYTFAAYAVTLYAVFGSYDDTCDGIHWGICDVRSFAQPISNATAFGGGYSVTAGYFTYTFMMRNGMFEQTGVHQA